MQAQICNRRFGVDMLSSGTMGIYVLDLPALESLRSPTLGVHIQGLVTQLRHVFGNEGQGCDQSSSTRWLNSFAILGCCIDVLPIILAELRPGVSSNGPITAEYGRKLRHHSPRKSYFLGKHGSTRRHVADRPRMYKPVASRRLRMQERPTWLS